MRKRSDQLRALVEAPDGTEIGSDMKSTIRVGITVAQYDYKDAPNTIEPHFPQEGK